MKRLLLLLPLLALCVAAGARERYAKVYMFGFSQSFADSVCVLTDVQAIDSAYISHENFLKERTLYAYQLEHFVEDNLGRRGTTCVVFWSEKRSAVERRFLKMRRKYSSNPDFKLQQLEAGRFKFVCEEHVE